MAMIIKSSVPRGHDPVLWNMAQAMRKTMTKKTGGKMPMNYSKMVKRHSKMLKLKGEY